ncbi:MAG: hypothetical protein AAB578_05510, partial [Elusimicrobiota bacterium]
MRCGSFRSLELAFLAELRSLKSGDPLFPAAVVAPSRAMADRLQRLAASENAEGLLAVSFHTFFSLASEIVREGGEPGWKQVGDPLFFDRLVDSLLEGGPRRSRRTRGLAAAYRSSLRDLADSGVEPRAADLAAEGLFEEKEGGALKELLALLGDYERELSRRKILSSSALTRRAAELA